MLVAGGGGAFFPPMQGSELRICFLVRTLRRIRELGSLSLASSPFRGGRTEDRGEGGRGERAPPVPPRQRVEKAGKRMAPPPSPPPLLLVLLCRARPVEEEKEEGPEEPPPTDGDDDEGEEEEEVDLTSFVLRVFPAGGERERRGGGKLVVSGLKPLKSPSSTSSSSSSTLHPNPPQPGEGGGGGGRGHFSREERHRMGWGWKGDRQSGAVVRGNGRQHGQGIHRTKRLVS